MHARTQQSAGRKGPRAGERGAVAMMSVFCMVALLSVFGVVIGYGFLMDARQRANATAESMALAFANQMVVQEGQYWALTQFAPETIAHANGFPANAVQFSAAPRRVFGDDFPNVSPFSDRWSPAMVTVQLSVAPPATGIDGLFTWLFRAGLPRLEARGAARINGVELASFDLQREQIVMVLDYSKSMRLRYEGGGGSLTGLDVMRSTGNEVSQHYKNVANMGMVLFSDGVASAKTVDMMNTTTPVTPIRTDGQLRKFGQALESGTMGDGTNLADAIEKAVSVLNNPTSVSGSGRSALPPYKTIFLVTDGEPDVGGEIDTRMSYQRKVEVASGLATDRANAARTAGINITTVWMQRTQPNPDIAQHAQDFLKGISGKKPNSSDSNNYSEDASDPGKIAAFLNSRPVIAPCESAPIYDLGSRGNRSVPRHLLPRAVRTQNITKVESINAFLYLGSQGRGGRETELVVPVDKIFFDRDKFLTYNYVNSPPIVDADQGMNLATLRNNPNFLAVYYDPETAKVYLSSAMCLALTGPQNKDLSMRFRMRWGVPRTVNSTVPALY